MRRFCIRATRQGAGTVSTVLAKAFPPLFAVSVGDGNNVALQVLQEVVGHTVIHDTANAVLVVVEGNENILAPYLTENLGTVKGVGVAVEGVYIISF